MNKRMLLVLLMIFCGAAFLPDGQASLKAQDAQLARNFFDQGEYEKALIIYKKAYKKEPNNSNVLLGIVKTQQQLEAYEEVEKLLKSKLSQPRNKGTIMVELGYNYKLQEKDSLATVVFNQAIELVATNSNNAYRVGRAFQEHSLLEEAVQTYETGMRVNPRANYGVQLARLYGELGQVEKMFDSYLNLVNKNVNYVNLAQRNFGQYITDDPFNEPNIIFRKLLIKKIQTEQNIMFNELLSWLFIQQKDYKKAFTQEKAIYKRSEGNIQGVVDLAGITIEAKASEISSEILQYIVDNAIEDGVKLDAKRSLLKLDIEKANTLEAKLAIKEGYEGLLKQYGNWDYAVPVKVDYAHFMAFNNDASAVAINYLKKEVKKERSRFPQARLKMELSDILVLEEKFNQALIYYTQVQKDIKNNVISQEARFKVAKTSYYKGDFGWAEAQLAVLKQGATQLIANDALELLLVIRDNSQEDSLQTALKKYAKADLMAYQNKKEKAIQLYTEILEVHKGESIEDEALLAQATLFEEKDAFAKAEKNYLTIIEYYGDGTLADNARFQLAELYMGVLNEPEKAKAQYERIIFDFQDSIYYVEAQKKFRQLRGDAIN